MPLILGTNSIKDTGYTVANSCRFNDGDSPKLNINFGSDGTLNKWTFSMWFKRSTLGTAQRLFCVLDSGMDDYIKFGTDDQLEWVFDNEDGSNKGVLKTNRKFRDVSAWYHLVCRLDTTDGTAGDRMRMYINGTEETSFATDTNPTQNETGDIGRDNNHYIGTSGSSQYFDGYIAEVCMINNQSLAPTSFGEFDEDSPQIFKPIDISGLTAGTNGFYLDFEDSGNLGNDAFGGTDWTETNLAATDQATDTPTNNFATLNAVNKYYDISTLSEANITYDGNSTASNYTFTPATIGFNKGKWYWEVLMGSGGHTGDWSGVGIVSANSTGLTNFMGESANSYGYYGKTFGSGLGVTYTNNTKTDQAVPFTEGDTIMCAVDCDNLAIYWGKDGTWLDNSSSVTGVPTSGASKTGAMFSITAPSSTTDGVYYPAACNFDTPAYVHHYNFGSPAYAITSGNADDNGYGNFEYDVPDGYLALCTKNLGSDGG